MGLTKISWASTQLTDGTVIPGYSHNPWWGCSSPAGAGCDHCYAVLLDRRTGGNYFGVGTRPRLTTEANRNKPFIWNRKAEADGIRRRVFCGSMIDYFDRHAPEAARTAQWEQIKSTTMLDWQILTKRPANIQCMLPPDWGDGYDNAWLGVTVENRRSGLRRLEQLRRIPARVRFISAEPLLEDLGEVDLTGIHWCIIGGESGHGFRPMRQEWVDRLIAQCRAQGVRVFFKQWGGTTPNAGGCVINGREIKEWPLTEALIVKHAHAAVVKHAAA